MKNLLTTLILAITTVTLSMATATPEATIISSETVSVNSSETGFFESASFNTESETLDFTTINDIEVIQIYDMDGNLEFQLPVMSNTVQLNKNLFITGQQKLGFVMKGLNQVHFSEVTIK